MPVKTNFLKIKQFKQRFLKTGSVSINDIKKFYDITSKSTLHWRIYKLLRMDVIQRIERGLYKLGAKNIFYPDLPNKTKVLYNKVKQYFPYARVCAWHTGCMNEFTKHQPGIHNHIIEAEKDTSESIYNFIKEQHEWTFINPTKEVYHQYISGKKESIIVLNLISESPTLEVDNVSMPTIEKILVDIFSDSVTFSPYQGNEMRTVFLTALKKYTINKSTLYRYAFRRGKKEELKTYFDKLSE